MQFMLLLVKLQVSGKASSRSRCEIGKLSNIRVYLDFHSFSTKNISKKVNAYFHYIWHILSSRFHLRPRPRPGLPGPEVVFTKKVVSVSVLESRTRQSPRLVLVSCITIIFFSPFWCVANGGHIARSSEGRSSVV